MTQFSPYQYPAEEIMSFLEQIEVSFQEAETFLQASASSLSQKGYGQDLAETIVHVQIAKQYVARLRQQLPSQLEQREDAILDALRTARANRAWQDPKS